MAREKALGFLFDRIHAQGLCCLEVLWPLSSNLEHLQNQVDKFKTALSLVKDLGSATVALCDQWKTAKTALEKHMKDEETIRQKEEARMKKLQQRCGTQCECVLCVC